MLFGGRVLSFWQPYLISALVGLLVGLEREKAHPAQGTMGVRTFLLMSLLGAAAGAMESEGFQLLIAFFALALVVSSYVLQARRDGKDADLGLTTEFAAGLVFCLGYASHTAPTLAALLGPAVALILFSKTTLHRFSRALQPAELEAALLLLLGGVVVVNLVPDKAIDPWSLFNPRKFGLLILTLATLEFSSYALVKLIGERRGSLLVGFLGGLVSSTAVTVSAARQAKATPGSWRTALASTLAAKLAALSELLLIVGLVSPSLLLGVLPAVLAGLCVGALAVALIARGRHGGEPAPLKLRSPLDWKGVLRLSLILAAILGAISATRAWLGDQGTRALSFLTGLFELHGVSLANATLFAQEALEHEVARDGILLAVLASLVAKVALAWSLERGPYARGLTLAFVPLALAVLAAALLR